MTVSLKHLFLPASLLCSVSLCAQYQQEPMQQAIPVQQYRNPSHAPNGARQQASHQQAPRNLLNYNTVNQTNAQARNVSRGAAAQQRSTRGTVTQLSRAAAPARTNTQTANANRGQAQRSAPANKQTANVNRGQAQRSAPAAARPNVSRQAQVQRVEVPAQLINFAIDNVNDNNVNDNVSRGNPVQLASLSNGFDNNNVNRGRGNDLNIDLNMDRGSGNNFTGVQTNVIARGLDNDAVQAEVQVQRGGSSAGAGLSLDLKMPKLNLDLKREPKSFSSSGGHYKPTISFKKNWKKMRRNVRCKCRKIFRQRRSGGYSVADCFSFGR